MGSAQDDRTDGNQDVIINASTVDDGTMRNRYMLTENSGLPSLRSQFSWSDISDRPLV